MLFVNEKNFDKLNEDEGRALQNSFVYLLSHSMITLGDGGDDVAPGNDKLVSLIPSPDLLENLKSGEVSKKKFAKAYLKELKSYDSRFILYTIIRSLNENKYLPIFVCSNDDWELGYLKILSSYLEKTFGLKGLNPKKYRKDISKMIKTAKKVSKKSKKRDKAFASILEEYIKDNINLSFDGLQLMEKLEKEFSIDRMAIIINHADSDVDNIKKKKIIEAIDLYSEHKKSSIKKIKRAQKAVGAHKKRKRWSKKMAIEVLMFIYGEIHSQPED